MKEKIRAYVREHSMLEKGDKVIVGVSGGADSICLLFMLLELKEEYALEITAVHVNHCLRGDDAVADERYVERVCKENGIPCRIYRKDIECIAKNRKQSTEEAGREVRRECFLDAAGEESGTKIALAHHMDDNAETLLLHLSRGSGLRGLGGMYPVRGRWIRPFLCVSRDEIEKYLQEQGISYCTDSTNFEDFYTRNRVRRKVLPILETEVNSQAVVHMNRTMEEVRMVWEYMDSQAGKAYREFVREEKTRIRILDSLWEEVPKILRTMVIHKALTVCAGREKDLSRVHILEVERLFSMQTSRQISLPYQMCARRTYGGVILEKSMEQGEETEKNFRYQVQMRVFEREEGEEAPQKRYTKWFDYDIIKGNVEIRTRRPGDYLIIDKEGRRQKLKSYFINEKIPGDEREKILLVADGDCILWIVGYRTSSTYQIGRHTKTVLEIQINGGEENGRDSQSIDTGRTGR